METARREGQHPTWVTPGQSEGPWGVSETNMDDREVGLRGGRGWGHNKPVHQPTSPSQANADVGHLLNMLVAGLRMGIPRINTFSGEATPGKTEVSFKQWYHKVNCTKNHYPEAVVWESIIQSLKGPTVDMARYMGPTTNIAHILCKLLAIFGMVASLTFSCRTSIRSPRIIMRRSPPLL